MRVKSILAGVVAAVALQSSARADWNYSGDYSPTNDPNGTWSYGYRSGIAGTGFTTFDNLGFGAGASSQLHHWGASFNSYVGAYKNFGASSLDLGEGTVFTPGDAFLHPLVSGDIVSVARWTAPAAGSYEVTFAVARCAGNIDGVSAFDLVVDGTSDYHALISSATYTPDVVRTYTLAAGDTLDFTASTGDGSDFHDSTGIRANIAAVVPEAGTAGFAAMLAFGALARRRPRR